MIDWSRPIEIAENFPRKAYLYARDYRPDPNGPVWPIAVMGSYADGVWWNTPIPFSEDGRNLCTELGITAGSSILIRNCPLRVQKWIIIGTRSWGGGEGILHEAKPGLAGPSQALLRLEYEDGIITNVVIEQANDGSER